MHRLPEWDAWLVVSHAEALSILTGPGWRSGLARSPRADGQQIMAGPGSELIRKVVLFADPPEHTPAAPAAPRPRARICCPPR